MEITTLDAIKLVKEADSPAKLFKDKNNAATIYKALVFALHPDTADKGLGGFETSVKNAWNKLDDFWQRYNSTNNLTLFTKLHTYKINEKLFSGSLADIYVCSIDNKIPSLAKIVRSPKNNDLLNNEAAALKILNKDSTSSFQRFLPQLIESVKIKDNTTKIERQINIINWEQDFYSLTEVKQQLGDLDPRDAAWIWRRLFHIVGYANSLNIVHAAILPDNVLIHPISHGVILIDWCYSSINKSIVKAIPSGYKDWYPKEVLEKTPPSAATDIYMVSQLMGGLIGEKLPSKMKAFIKGCSLERQTSRPGDAWKLREELDDLLYILYGKRKYRPLVGLERKY